MFKRFGVSKISFFCFASLGLAACGGGGGGSSTSTTTAFTSWLNITHPSTVLVGGKGYEGTYSYNVATSAVTSVGAASQASSPTLKLTYNSSGTLTNADLTTTTQSQAYDSFSSANASNTLFFGLKTTDSNDWALAAEPLDDDLNWRYQSIAIWTDPDSGSGKYGAITGGSSTVGSSIPTSGSTTFSGHGGGFYSDASNNIYVTQSDVSATANFASRSVSVSATNTGKQLYDGATGTFGTYANDSNLNFSGTLTYGSADNNLSGTFTTTSGMSGPAVGSFYGPEANEIGAAFNMTGGSQTYVGAFGAK